MVENRVYAQKPSAARSEVGNRGRPRPWPCGHYWSNLQYGLLRTISEDLRTYFAQTADSSASRAFRTLAKLASHRGMMASNVSQPSSCDFSGLRPFAGRSHASRKSARVHVEEWLLSGSFAGAYPLSWCSRLVPSHPLSAASSASSVRDAGPAESSALPFTGASRR